MTPAQRARKRHQRERRPKPDPQKAHRCALCRGPITRAGDCPRCGCPESVNRTIKRR